MRVVVLKFMAAESRMMVKTLGNSKNLSIAVILAAHHKGCSRERGNSPYQIVRSTEVPSCRSVQLTASFRQLWLETTVFSGVYRFD
jgi:hypothetical protein